MPQHNRPHKIQINLIIDFNRLYRNNYPIGYGSGIQAVAALLKKIPETIQFFPQGSILPWQNVINWFDVPTLDFSRAVKFYSEILGKPIRVAEHMGQTLGFFSDGWQRRRRQSCSATCTIQTFDRRHPHLPQLQWPTRCGF